MNKCIIEGCNNLGEFRSKTNTGITRRKLCSTHRRKNKKNYLPSGKKGVSWIKFKNNNCKICEYCKWEGPCDCHRPNIGKYIIGNMRSTCPNCHRLITQGLMIDKFKELC